MRETRIQTVKRILEDYYTPERVDVSEELDGNGRHKILIWFPNVTVTNENNQSVDIQDLFVRLFVTSEGKLAATFQMGRTTFPRIQAEANYIHSHCNGIVTPGRDQFYSCCLGSGPLVSTCASLNREFSESTWMLFCGELDLYTKTESIAGVPYRYLNQLGRSGGCIFDNLKYTLIGYIPRADTLYTQIIDKIIEDGRLPITYSNGHYVYALPDLDVALEINRCFLEVYDDYSHRVRHAPTFNFYNVVMADGKLYNQGTYRHIDSNAFSGSYITFKGEQKPVRIIDNREENNNSFRFVDANAICWIASLILEVVNTKFNVQ